MRDTIKFLLAILTINSTGATPPIEPTLSDIDIGTILFIEAYLNASSISFLC